MEKLRSKTLKGCLDYFMENYISIKNNKENEEEFKNTIENEGFENILKSAFKLNERLDKEDYKIQFKNNGRNAKKPDCPHIPIFYTKITEKSTKRILCSHNI